jgi:hypothetical protein
MTLSYFTEQDHEYSGGAEGVQQNAEEHEYGGQSGNRPSGDESLVSEKDLLDVDNWDEVPLQQDQQSYASGPPNAAYGGGYPAQQLAYENAMVPANGPPQAYPGAPMSPQQQQQYQQQPPFQPQQPPQPQFSQPYPQQQPYQQPGAPEDPWAAPQQGQQGQQQYAPSQGFGY